MVKHKEFIAWITVDDEPLREYNVAKDGNKATCFIPSEVGKAFKVHWRDEGSKTFTAGYIFIDGFASPGRFLGGSGETYRSGARSGPNTERSFVFAEVPKTASSESKEVGTIELKIMQAQRGPARTNNDLAILPSPLPGEYTETTGGHCATFNKEETPCFPQAPLTWSAKPLDNANPHSYVKFVFYYRPMSWLIEHGMAQLPSSQPPRASILGIANFVVPPVDLSVDGPHRAGTASTKSIFAADPLEDAIFAPRKPPKPRAPNGTAKSRSKKKEKEKQVVYDEPDFDPEELKPKPVREHPSSELSVMELKAKYMPHLCDPPLGPPTASKQPQKPQKPSQPQQGPRAESSRSQAQSHRQQGASNLSLPSQSQYQSGSSNTYVLPVKSGPGPGPSQASAATHYHTHRPSAILDTRVYMHNSPPASTPSDSSSDRFTEPPTPLVNALRTSHMRAQAMPMAGSSMQYGQQQYGQQQYGQQQYGQQQYGQQQYPYMGGGPVPSLSNVTRLDSASAALAMQYTYAQRGGPGPSMPPPGFRQSSRYSPDLTDYDS
ncbi:hypothetical protein M0805_009517 [Coniferiporia weirii]|nr:hypothetical protein M0805_009517 [Coniferiporia weirii]